MWGIGLIICAVMFVGMLATGGPHHMADIHDRFRNAVHTDHSQEQISGGQQPAMHGGHDHVGTDTGGVKENEENREP